MSEKKNSIKKEHQLWYWGIAISLSGSLLVECAIQSTNSNGFVKINWIVCYILSGIFFFGISQKVGKVMDVPGHYIKWLRIAMLLIVVVGVIDLLLTISNSIA